MTRGMVWLTACVSLMWVLASARRADATLVDTTNFTESTLTFVSGGNVTGIAWAPDGSNRMFVTQKGGAVRVIKDGSVLAGNFATETVYTNSECGLIGIAFDPDFVSNGYVYFFKTATANEQQIIRYTAVGDVGTNRTVLVSNLPTAGQNHDGGAVGVGPDGKLYWAIGDLGNGTGVDANLSSLAAKVGRANIDGSIPNDNPFYDGDGPNNDYIWARGFRNPFTFTWQPSTELLWLNVVGTSYEQVFVVDRGSHGGWDNYENTQPLSGYLQPIIKYRTGTTQSFTISTAVRDSDVVTFTTTTRHRLRRGEPITVASVVDTSFNGSFHVVDTPTDPNAADATWFTVTQVGSDTSSSGGTVTTLAQGNAITGGTFYDGTAFPAAYRGNFFYGDFGSNRVMRAVIEAGPAVKSVDYFSSNIGTYIDAEVGPDGALYYASNNGTVYRVTYNATQQGLILSRTHFWFSEGKQAALSVRLAVAPLADVEVNTTHSTGSTDLALNAGATLTFTPGNYATPQVIRLQAAEDADTTDDTATFTVSSNDLASETVYVRARDDDSNVTLVVSDAALNLNEGTTEQFTVSLGEMPSDDVTVNVARSLGDADVTVQAGGSLTFTTADWATPQSVTVAAAHDVDTIDDEATLEVTANLATPHTVEVSVNDDDPLAPVISSEPVTTATEDAPYQYDVEATGTPTPTYSLTTSPGGMTIDANTGIIAWTPTSTGSFPVTVLASNGVAPNDEQSFAIEVSVDLPPNCTLTRPTSGEIVQGTGAEFYGDGTDDVGTVSAEFSIDAVLDYTDTNSAGHYHFGGSHVLWDTTQYSDGLHTVRMTVYDTSGQSCFVEVDVTIANSALPDAGTQDAGTQLEAGTSDDAGTDPDGVDASFPMDAAAFDAALGLDAEIPDVDALDASVASDATAPDPSDTDATMTNPPIVDPLDAASGGVGGSSNSTTDAALPAAESSVEQSGCGCSTPGTPTRSRDLGLCVALLALALRVRRRSS